MLYTHPYGQLCDDCSTPKCACCGKRLPSKPSITWGPYQSLGISTNAAGPVIGSLSGASVAQIQNLKAGLRQASNDTYDTRDIAAN